MKGKVVLGPGTNRQSDATNVANMEDGSHKIKHTSAIHSLAGLAKKWKLKLQPLLLADLFYAKKPGTSFKEAIKTKGYSEYLHKGRKEKETGVLNGDFFFTQDPNKISLIYAQIHHFALTNKKRPIVVHFMDDNKDILDNLANFFGAHPEYIPKGITLQLGQYAPRAVSPVDIPQLYSPIAGKKEFKADKNYRQTIYRINEQYIEIYDYLANILPAEMIQVGDVKSEMVKPSVTEVLFANPSMDVLSLL